MKFYIGLHQPSDARHFERAFVSINRVRERRSPVLSSEWIMDSGAFREIDLFGGYRHPPAQYAADVNRIAAINPGLIAAVSQDYMCEPVMLQKTKLTVRDHQRLTIERYDAIKPLVKTTLIPVLQGYTLASYLDHIDMYAHRLQPSMLVGVGSICKRNTDIGQIRDILYAIKCARPHLNLHGFGLKITALQSGIVRACLYSADSMAWSFSARRDGRNANSWLEAKAFADRIATMPVLQWA
jgi:hypothetical protein